MSGPSVEGIDVSVEIYGGLAITASEIGKTGGMSVEMGAETGGTSAETCGMFAETGGASVEISIGSNEPICIEVPELGSASGCTAADNSLILQTIIPCGGRGGIGGRLLNLVFVVICIFLLGSHDLDMLNNDTSNKISKFCRFVFCRFDKKQSIKKDIARKMMILMMV
jgi:hypothetical protein